ncbi:putative cytochrome P450 YjiB [Dictyobacter alpinus]|uniref:Putative cytochrome P450 YjiB n=1 Tax=Dictyobacter alpinus TaxID=2014873 RepID=A0A402B0C1_9CHLR|nr:cytochrome P450 [Dictyobacter alpinus]GCE24790.1 putative cytochrome P450 YjiB [Dictyobacter alpinus]
MMNPRDYLNQLLYPYASFTALRTASGPVVHNEKARFWEVFEYDDVLMLASEHETFSSDGSKFADHPEEFIKAQSILTTDPPRHRQLRSLVSQAFTPRAIASMAPRIAEITHDLLDHVVGQGSMDIITDLSYPLPVIVISELLGVPAEDRAQFKRWSDDMVFSEYDELTAINVEEYNERMRQVIRRTLDELYDYFRIVLAERRLQPCQDLVSELLAARIEGQSLSEAEILAFCTLLLIAGNITTTNLIGNALLCFDEHPETMDQLAERPDLLPQAIEEVLRYRSPALLLARYTTRDVELHGQTIPCGQMILGWIASANFDPQQFPHPEAFDITRSPNRHLAFGHGIHFCLGAPLARLEAKIALSILLERFQQIRRNREQPVETIHSAFILGPKHCPVTFKVRQETVKRVNI